MTVLVAIPYFGCPEFIARCVNSVLSQTVTDLRVVVVGDGEEPPLASINDDRLEVYTLRENHGAYFAHQLILEANPFEFHSIVDADDYVDPRHIERMLAQNRTAIASGALYRHDLRLARSYQGVWSTPMGSHCGLYAPNRLRRVGGYSPHRRVAEDTLVLKLLYYTGGYHKTLIPTYHRVKREGSLTVTPSTGIGSGYRNEVWEQNLTILSECRKLLPDLDAVRAYRTSLVPEDVRADLASHVEQLRARLGNSLEGAA